MNIKNNRKGYLLPTILIFIVISIILGMGILYLGGLEQVGAQKRLNREKAFYVAEAGAYRAFAHLRNNIEWEAPPENEPVSFGDGNFTLSIAPDPDRKGADEIKLTSTGNVNEKYHEKVELSLGYRNIWSQGIFGMEIVQIGNSIIDGCDSTTGVPEEPSEEPPDAEVGSKEEINMDNPNATIYGNASVGGNILEGGLITGNRDTGVDFGNPFENLGDEESEVIIPNDLREAGHPSPPKIKGGYSYTYNDPPDDSTPILTIKDKGSVTIQGGDYRFKEIIFEGDSELIFEGPTRLYVEDQIDLSANKTIWTMNGEVVLYLGENSTMFTGTSEHIDITTFQDRPENFRIYSASTRDDAIDINNNRTLFALIYAPNGSVRMKNNIVFCGGIVSEKIYINNDAVIYYDVNLNNLNIDDDPRLKGPLQILRWRKPGWTDRLH